MVRLYTLINYLERRRCVVCQKRFYMAVIRYAELQDRCLDLELSSACYYYRIQRWGELVPFHSVKMHPEYETFPFDLLHCCGKRTRGSSTQWCLKMPPKNTFMSLTEAEEVLKELLW